MDSSQGLEFDPVKAGDRIEEWRRKAGRVNAEAVSQILEDSHSRHVLTLAFAHAPYLTRCCLAHPDAVVAALKGNAEQVLVEVERDLHTLDRAAGSVNALTRAVRPCKERAVVAIGLSDISGQWSTDKVGRSLSALAHQIVDASLSWLTRMAYRNGDIGNASDVNEVPLPGLFLIAGGEVATSEVGYCGPVELLVGYDRNAFEAKGINATDLTITKLIGSLNDALRVHREAPAIFQLELDGPFGQGKSAGDRELARPIGSISEALEAATIEQRAWFLSANVIGGDKECGQRFLNEAREEISNKGISSADIGKAVQLEGSDPSHGHDEVWRFLQTCRLALGVRVEAVRHGASQCVFEEAVKTKAIDSLTATRLAANVGFVQNARNRLQLIDGRSVFDPASEQERVAQAALCGYTDTELFKTVLLGCRAEAQQQWLNIMNPPKIAAAGSQFTQSEQTDTKLEEIGFGSGQEVGAIVDRWMAGVTSDETTESKRRRLSEVSPGLLTEFGHTQFADTAISLFDNLMSRLPEGVDLFGRINENPAFGEALVDFLGNAPLYAQYAVGNEGLTSELFLEDADVPATPEEWVSTYTPPRGQDKPFDEYRSDVQEWVETNRARLCFQTVSQKIMAEDFGGYLTEISETAVQLLYNHLAAGDEESVAEGRGLAVIALGDFGGYSLKAGAPIDLAFVYDAEGEAGESGESAAQYRGLAEQLAQALTAKTSNGQQLFDIDLRQRPGGAGGDIATSLPIYLNFYTKESHPEEHLALTRARVICGAPSLKNRLETAIADCVSRPRKVERLMIDSDKAQTKLHKQNMPSSVWDVDLIKGGMNDLNFIAEVLQVRYGAENPYVLAQTTPDAIAALSRAGCLDPDTATDLVESHLFWNRLGTVLALVGKTNFSDERPRQRLATLIAKTAGVSGFGSVEPLIQGHAERVTAHYRRLILGDENAKPCGSVVAA